MFNGLLYSDEEKEALLSSIYEGKTDINNLPPHLYRATADKLNEAVVNGVRAGQGFNFGDPDIELIRQLKENIYIFSGAKTATQILDIQSLMVKDGKVVEYADFKKAALNRFNTYNGKEGYLESEYITAQTASSSAKTWEYTKKNKDVFPRLKSVAIIDKDTAPECERMNGVVAGINDPIWIKNKSPRHWRCRCYEIPVDKFDDEKNTPQSKLDRIAVENNKDMQPVFKNNPGITKVIFNKDHPYFDVARAHIELAKKNFNLPIP